MIACSGWSDPMNDEWIPCPDCGGRGTVRVCGGHGDYDNALRPRCNPDRDLRMVGIPDVNSGLIPPEG